MPLSSSGKPYYTKEQMAEAKTCSALEYARSRHYDLVPSSSGRCHLRQHDSMVFLPDGRWYWNSQHQSGRALDFMISYEGRTMLEAVLTLTNDSALLGSTAPVCYQARASPDALAAPFILPERAGTSRQLFAYLCSTRGLSPDILLTLIHEGRLYQGQHRLNEQTIYNAVFVGLDDQGRPRNAFQRGITSRSTFKNGVHGSDKSWPFLIPGAATADTLAVFEAAIDAISHATIVNAESGKWTQITRMAVGGNFPIRAVTNYLDTHPAIRTVACAFDSDETGQKLAEYLAAGLRERPTHLIRFLPPLGKDWNQYLTDHWQKTRGKKPKGG